MSEPDLNLLPALDALLKEVSVAGAARRLGLSASAMSRTLSRLRETTGDPLLVRAGRNMVLTPYAQAVRERAHHAVEETRAILSPARQVFSARTLQRTFTLRTNEGFAEAVGPTLIAEVAAVAPGVMLMFTPKAEKSSLPLRESQVDLEIGVVGGMGPEIRLQALFRDRFIAVIRRGHPLCGVERITPEQYVQYPHVVTSRRGQASGPVDEALAQLGLQRTLAAVVASFQAALAIAQQSEVIALVPASLMIHRQQDRQLFCFDLPVTTASITVSQMWHPRMEADPAHRWLRQQVRSVCQRLLPQ